MYKDLEALKEAIVRECETAKNKTEKEENVLRLSEIVVEDLFMSECPFNAVIKDLEAIVEHYYIERITKGDSVPFLVDNFNDFSYYKNRIFNALRFFAELEREFNRIRYGEDK